MWCNSNWGKEERMEVVNESWELKEEKVKTEVGKERIKGWKRKKEGGKEEEQMVSKGSERGEGKSIRKNSAGMKEGRTERKQLVWEK